MNVQTGREAAQAGGQQPGCRRRCRYAELQAAPGLPSLSTEELTPSPPPARTFAICIYYIDIFSINAYKYLPRSRKNQVS